VINFLLGEYDWVKTYIYTSGALGKCYPLNGAGTNGMKEGDSPSFLGLIHNGLNFPEHPEWGGWGGRYRKMKENLYIDTQDFLNGTLNERHTVSRWRPAFQRDFMARLAWSVNSRENANHNPVPVVNHSTGLSPLRCKAKAGSKMLFDASESSDPDGDHLSYRWYFYHEIHFVEDIQLKSLGNGGKCRVHIPKHCSGQTVHLICEITDDGFPPLSAYKRIIIQTE